MKVDQSNADLHQGGFIGGFYVRQMPLLKKGEIHKGHAHYIDHIHNLVRGQIRIDWITPSGEKHSAELLVPCKVLIKRDNHHTITALVDDTLGECWFSEAEAEKQGIAGVDYTTEKNNV